MFLRSDDPFRVVWRRLRATRSVHIECQEVGDIVMSPTSLIFRMLWLELARLGHADFGTCCQTGQTARTGEDQSDGTGGLHHRRCLRKFSPWPMPGDQSILGGS